MIDKQLLFKTVEQAIEGTSIFIVDIRINPGNAVVVEIDSFDSVDIETCASITRKIEAVFDREKEDYDLEVGSAGLTAPFKVKDQYLKNIGNEVEALTCDGRKLQGVLTSVGDDEFTIEIAKKVKEPGAKRPSIVMEPVTLKIDNTKSVKYLINFK
ncbi:MAG: ribosome assembly cofactor RimP [Bacteroidales bacterium]|nr:ribosome assembly cofactor RimP [Bacteroidales bacterium]